MATVDKGGTVTLQELLVTSLAQTDAVAIFWWVFTYACVFALRCFLFPSQDYLQAIESFWRI